MADNGLTFRFSADTGGAQRAIQNLAGSAGRNLALLGGSAVLASRNVAAINGAARQAGAGMADLGRWVSNHKANIGTVVRLYSLFKVAQFGIIAGTAALTAAVSGANKALEQMAAVFKGAEAAGVSTTFFQVFARQADALKIKADDAAAALKKASEATRITVDDSGQRVVSEPVKLLRKIEEDVPGVGLQADIINNSPDAQQRIEALLKSIQEIQRVAREIGSEDLRLWAVRLSEVSFGDTGKEIAAAIAAGNFEMARLKAEAAQAGTIFDAGIVQKARDVQVELDAANKRLRDTMVPLLQQLGLLALDFKSTWADIVNGIAGAVEQARRLTGETEKLRGGFLDRIFGKGATFAFDAGLTLARNPAGIAQQVIKDSQRAPRGASSPGVRELVAPNIPPDIRRRLAARIGFVERTSSGDNFDAANVPAKTGGKTAGGADTPDAVERYVKQAERAIALLEAEAAALGKTRAERTIAVELAKAENAAKERGTPLTEAELANINRLATARGNLTEQIRKQREAEEAVRRASEFFGQQTLGALRDIIVAGENAEDVMKRLGIAILNAALQASLFGGGPLGKLGLFNSFGEGGIIGQLGKGFAGMFASGGYIPAGQWGIAGEAGPEIITGPANVIPAMRAGGMGMGGVTVKNYGEAGLVSVQRVNDMIEVRVAEAFRYTDTRVAGSDRTTFARVREQNARQA